MAARGEPKPNQTGRVRTRTAQYRSSQYDTCVPASPRTVQSGVAASPRTVPTCTEYGRSRQTEAKSDGQSTDT